jgi:hypothetical protein
MPAWKQNLLKDQLKIEELKELGCGEDDIEYEDLIAKFVKQSIENMKVNMEVWMFVLKLIIFLQGQVSMKP